MTFILINKCAKAVASPIFNHLACPPTSLRGAKTNRSSAIVYNPTPPKIQSEQNYYNILIMLCSIFGGVGIIHAIMAEFLIALA